MELSKLYKMIHGDYQNVLERIEDKQLIENFVIRFLDDSSFEQLIGHLNKNDIKQAFYSAHNLKGVTQSLGFDRLGEYTGAVCEELRKKTAPSESLLRQLQEEYNCVITAINKNKKDI